MATITIDAELDDLQLMNGLGQPNDTAKAQEEQHAVWRERERNLTQGICKTACILMNVY